MGCLRLSFISVVLAFSIAFYVSDVNARGRSRKIPAPVPQTGQDTSYYPGDDGDLQVGKPWPIPRFIDNGNGTVTDRLTGLVWLKDANCFGQKTWTDALDASNNLENGSCGLTDRSSPGDWRLANVNELLSLMDYSVNAPALQVGHPFTNVQAAHYWSSTMSAGGGTVWHVYLGGGVGTSIPSSSFYVWCVRGGE